MAAVLASVTSPWRVDPDFACCGSLRDLLSPLSKKTARLDIQGQGRLARLTIAWERALRRPAATWRAPALSSAVEPPTANIGGIRA